MGSSKKEHCPCCSHKCLDRCCCLTSKSSREKEKRCKKRKLTCSKKDTIFHNKSNNTNFLIKFDSNQEILSNQFSDSIIIVKNSCNVDVNLTNRQTILIFQTFIQLLTIFLLLIGFDDNSIKRFIEEVSQIIKGIQENKQEVIIKNSSHVSVTAKNTETVIFIQTFLQAFLVLLVT
ncbi:spore coat protein [Priestia aryabhattai]|uniref:spore coat protein n=1 Tax=Priestia aryabhattai TaxID=412384 RepID=UPI0015F5BBEA|nr:spore coat protein [Priestia aryabhattai]MBZ6483982.1 spore coat protein [Priestia aryabhattai]